MKKIRLGINGFGRTGRAACRIALDRMGIDVVAINSRADATSHAYLLKYDSTYGVFPHQIKAQRDVLSVDGKKIKVFRNNDPGLIPWSKVSVDIVVEATGVYRSQEEAGKHLVAGAKKVIISAPAKDTIPTFCLGVNEKEYDPENHHVVSNASCTTNCLATVIKVLNHSFGIVRGFMTTTHAYTDSQNLLDNSHQKDLRLGRSAPANIIPTGTGASQALAMVLPHLGGKIMTSAVRVPVGTVSLIDLVVEVKQAATASDVNDAFSKASKTNMKGILSLIGQPLVSSDIKGLPFSAIVDGLLTQVSGKLVNVKAWYDNEWGYATRLVDLVEYIAKKGI